MVAGKAQEGTGITDGTGSAGKGGIGREYGEFLRGLCYGPLILGTHGAGRQRPPSHVIGLQKRCVQNHDNRVLGMMAGVRGRSRNGGREGASLHALTGPGFRAGGESYHVAKFCFISSGA